MQIVASCRTALASEQQQKLSEWIKQQEEEAKKKQSVCVCVACMHAVCVRACSCAHMHKTEKSILDCTHTVNMIHPDAD
jgi:hypothetical protein